MESKSRWENVTAPHGGTARVEIGTVMLNGREYTEMGAIVDHDGGRIVGYPWQDTGGQNPHSPNGQLRTWGGENMGPCWITGESRGFYGVKITHFRAVVDGIPYYGKGLGWGMILRLKRASTGRGGVKS